MENLNFTERDNIWGKIKRRYRFLYKRGYIPGKNVRWEDFALKEGPHGNHVTDLNVSTIKMRVGRGKWAIGLEIRTQEDQNDLEKVMSGEKFNCEKHCLMVEQLAYEFHTKSAVYKAMGLSKGKFDYWVKQHQEFKEAYEEGKDRQEEELFQAQRERALGSTVTEREEKDGKKGIEIKYKEKELAGDVNAQELLFKKVNPEQYDKNHVKKDNEEDQTEKILGILGELVE